MRRPAETPPDLRGTVTTLEGLWRHLFRSPVHLDSALAKLPSVERGAVAAVASLVLRAPIATAEALGITLGAGEPWALDREALATWPALPRLARPLFDEPELAAIEARVVPSTRDFPPSMIDAWRRAFGETDVAPLGAVLARRPPLALRASMRLGAAGLVAALPAELGASASMVAPLGVVLPRHAPVTRLSLFEEGAFELQDEGSQLLALFALHPELVAPPSPRRSPCRARSATRPSSSTRVRARAARRSRSPICSAGEGGSSRTTCPRGSSTR
ncbi:hypothetical protein L6R52_24180 [Myxococcota bacterium]|nr:hypothetical protein [Myxococcota bacterium]